jgi:hypothetical protein
MADDNDAPVTDANPDPDAGAKKALQAERERARKAEADAKAAREELAKLKADLEGGKTDAERMAAKVAELEKRANDADLRALRAEVAAEKGLTPAQARRLQGTSKEELERDADELLEAFRPASSDGSGDDDAGKQQRPAAGKPRENLRPGATPPADTSSEQYDSAKLLAAVPRG